MKTAASVRSAFREYFDLTVGLRRYLRGPAPGPGAVRRIREQLERREQRWLELVRRSVFDRPGHPYRRLFERAGCEFGDLENAVRAKGLEGALSALYDEGVYLTEDEFRGRAPIRRRGLEIESRPELFRNPCVRRGVLQRSSGTTGRPAVAVSAAARDWHLEIYRLLEAQEFELERCARLLVRPILPSVIGLVSSMSFARMGLPAHGWFGYGGSVRRAWHYRILTRYLVGFVRLHGLSVPSPRYLPPGDFTPVARWLAGRLRRGERCYVGCFVSPAVRTAAAAAEEGTDLSGTMFFAGGEELTPARREAIEASGAEVYSRYWIGEVGPIGFPCRRQRGTARLHLLSDSVAVLVEPKTVRGLSRPVPALWFTTLLPMSSFILINAEMGDAGEISRSRCDCTYARLGFEWEISGIRSYSKLTGQGMTVFASDVVRILERTLPQRFGGTAGDYQLIEGCDRGAGLELRVRPGVTEAPAEAISECFLGELRRCYGGALSTEVWRHSGALRVTAADPLVGPTGKVLPLHLLGRFGGEVR